MRQGAVTALYAGLILVAALGTPGAASAAPYVLTNAPGDGTVTVGVDGYGSFGSSIGDEGTNAVYDPIGPGGVGGTVFESMVAIRLGGAPERLYLTTDAQFSGLPNPTVTGTSTTGSSSFAVGDLSFSLSQTLAPLVSGGSQVGSQLTQVYTIVNTGQSELSFELIRYLDGDLLFDASLVDGGGRLVSGSTEILFETDSATGAIDPTTFVGITGEGGTVPASGRFEIDLFAGLRTRIASGTALDDTIAGDGPDADQFIDAGNGYDVTLALRNTFTLLPSITGVYTTRTIWGTGAPEDVPPPDGTVPEPGTILLLAAGMTALAARARRRRRPSLESR